jgi:hypothetical protein
MEIIMRVVLTAFVALLVAACVEAKPSADGELAGGAEGYTLEIRASEAEQVYLITAPDGETVAGRAVDGVSTLMDSAAIQALAAVPAISEDQRQEVVALRLPGLNLSVSGDPSGKGEQGGRVSIDIGDHSVEVNADEGGPGEADRAHVLIRGVPESEVREFIAKADQLSPAVQAQMLAELGLQ